MDTIADEDLIALYERKKPYTDYANIFELPLEKYVTADDIKEDQHMMDRWMDISKRIASKNKDKKDL